jgi:hypothetical protein
MLNLLSHPIVPAFMNITSSYWYTTLLHDIKDRQSASSVLLRSSMGDGQLPDRQRMTFLKGIWFVRNDLHEWILLCVTGMGLANRECNGHQYLV